MYWEFGGTDRDSGRAYRVDLKTSASLSMVRQKTPL